MKKYGFSKFMKFSNQITAEQIIQFEKSIPQDKQFIKSYVPNNKSQQYDSEDSQQYDQYFATLYQLFYKLDLFKYVTEYSQQYFGWDSYQKPQNFLKKIIHIDFYNLKTLYLCHTNINNIQILPWMNTPQLQTFFISSNQITSLKPLIKTNFYKIQLLQMQNNKFHSDQLRFLTRTDLNQYQLSQLRISDIQSQTFQLNNLFKIKLSKSLENPIGFSQIYNKKVYSALMNKFTQSQSSFFKILPKWMRSNSDFSFQF